MPDLSKGTSTKRIWRGILVFVLALMLAFGPFSFEIKFGLPRISFQTQKVYAATYAETFTATGTLITWVAPVGVATATIETWGAGAGGGVVAGNAGAGGGGGGAYAASVRNVTAGASYTVIVGAGGLEDQTVVAASSSFRAEGASAGDVFALGGGGTNGAGAGAAGDATNSSGTTKNAGGAGGAPHALDGSGGGGGAGGPDGAGVTAETATSTLGTKGGNGNNNSGGVGGAGGGTVGGANELGGGGGGGGNDSATVGGRGGLPGAGGGGANNGVGSAGKGADGQVKITYEVYTVLGDGTNPGNVTIAPGASATSSNAFTFKTSTSTDIVTAITVGLTPNTTSGISKVEITSDDSATVYGSSTNPTANSFSITLNQNTLTATITTTTYRIRLTPKAHTDMPAVPGQEYAVTSTIVSFTPTSNTATGSDGTSTIITIDNLSPNEVSATSTTPGSGQIDLAWTNPGADFSNLLIARATSTAVTGTPTEGSSSSVGTAFGNGFIIYTGSGISFSDTGLSDGTTYFYKIFAKDINGNFSASGVGLTATTNAAAVVNPQIRTAANETFTIGDPVTAISAITVTSTAASQITAANDIRIILATSTGAPVMFWDTSDLTATISGTGDVATAVTYEDASSTLVLNVQTDFANASSVTISGLGYIASSTVNAATTTRDLKWQGAGQAPPFARATSTTVTIRGRLELGEHSAGQEADKFAASSTYSNQELFAFQLLPNDEAASTTLVVQLSSITGILTADITGAKIFKDDNANGALDGGDTTQAFGDGTVAISGATGSITFNTTTSTVASATSTRYILKATTTDLLAGDTMTLSLGASDVTADGQTSKVRLAPTAASPPSNAAHTVNAVSRTERSFRWQNDDGANVNSNSAMAAADTAVSNVNIGQRLTLRVQVDNDGGGDSGIQYLLQYQANGTSSSWTAVSSGNAIQPSQGQAGANNDPVTSAAGAANSRTFTNGVWHEDTGISSSTTLLNNRYTEFAYVIHTSGAASGTTYYFRAANNSGPTALDAYPLYPSLATVSSPSDVVRYSKQAGSLPTATSSLTFFFDDLEYTNASTSDNAYATSTASGNIPIMNFRLRNTTSSHPLKITWEGQYSAASTTFVDVYRFGATNAWQVLTSTSSPSVNTDFTLTHNLTTSTSEYYETDGANFWTYYRVRQATTTGSLRTDQIKIEYVPAADSAADQTFEVSQAAAAISQIRIKSSRTPVIATSTDVRIKIPSSLNMSWATSTVTPTFGGSAVGKVAATVSYPDDKTLLIDVTTNFAPDDDLTISGLSFRDFTSVSASTTLQAFYDGSGDGGVDSVDAKIKQIRGKYDVNNHAAGQENNKFDISGAGVTAAELLAFQLVSTGENATTSQIVVDLFDVVGFTSSTITNVELRVDSNNDGTIGGGETGTVGGTGTVSGITGASGTITFSTAFTVTSTMNIVLRADVSDIDSEDVIKLRVEPADVTATGQTSVLTLAPGGSTPSASHSKPSRKGGSGSPIDGAPPSATPVGGGGQSGGGATEGGGGGGGSVGGGGAGGGGAAP